MDAWTFHGHLGRDAELRMTKSGVAVVNFSVACKRGWGEKEKTVWVECAWFGQRAEKVVQWLTKGSHLLVTGEPDVSAWEKRDGSGIGCALQCVVRDVDFLGGSERGESRAPSPHEPAPVAAAAVAAVVDEDVPF